MAGTRTSPRTFERGHHTRGVDAHMALRERDFDLHALYEALDERRHSRNLTWAALTAEVNVSWGRNQRSWRIRRLDGDRVQRFVSVH